MLLKVLTFFALFICVHSHQKIVGGMQAALGRFPHMADLSVQIHGKTFHLCGAALIHSKWIITAGHCAIYAVKNKSFLNVTLGVVDITNGPHKWSTIVPYEDIIIHENYTDNGEMAANDVALLRIRKIVFFSEQILPIKLPSRRNSKTFAGEVGILSGWGFNINRQRNESNVLQFIYEQILSNSECSKQNAHYPATVDSEICISSSNGKTACPGDSGSPLIVSNESTGDILVGITSYVDIGAVCKSDSNGPVVFMRVSYFIDWIEAMTGVNFTSY